MSRRYAKSVGSDEEVCDVGEGVKKGRMRAAGAELVAEAEGP